MIRHVVALSTLHDRSHHFLVVITNYQDQSDSVQYMMKKRQNNDVTNHIGMLYTENDTKQL